MLLRSAAFRVLVSPLLFVAACTNAPTSVGEPAADSPPHPPALAPRSQRSSRPPIAATPKGAASIAASAPANMEEVFRGTGLPDTPTGRELFEYLVAAEKPADKGAADRDAAMTKLDLHKAEVVATLVDAYEHLDETEYTTRMDIVYLLGCIRDPAAVAALETIARSSVPPERYAPDTEGGSHEREFAIRGDAIQAIGGLELASDEVVSRSLRGLAVAGLDRRLRALAVRGYLKAGDFVARSAELRSVLDPKEHWMLAR